MTDGKHGGRHMTFDGHTPSKAKPGPAASEKRGQPIVAKGASGNPPNQGSGGKR